MIITTTNQRPDELTFEKARKGILFEENGLWGLKDEDGNVIVPPKNLFIGKCIDNVIFIKPDWHYMKLWPYGTEKSLLSEVERPYIVNGKAGFMKDGKMMIPPEYEYLSIVFGGDDGKVFLAAKEGRTFYLDESGKEVLTHVKRFPNEELKHSPFWLVTDKFDYFTTMSYVGSPQESNPNVVKLDGAWVELERYSKDEILQMLINPNDDLALMEENLQLLCSPFSYEYSIYFANARGKNSIQKCREQLQKMNVFCNSWYYIVKIWLAPGEQLQAKELRDFSRFLGSTKNRALDIPLFAVGHCDSLCPGEVRMLMITHYHERCWPPSYEFEWSDKCKDYPICKLKDELSWLRSEIDKNVRKEYREEVFNDLVYGCVSELKYYKEQSWEQAFEALEYFWEVGSSVRYSLLCFLAKAKKYRAKKVRDDHATHFFLKAAMWALEKGEKVNRILHRRTALDYVNAVMETDLEGDVFLLSRRLRARLMQKGAKTYRQLRDEQEANTNYFKELEYLRAE